MPGLCLLPCIWDELITGVGMHSYSDPPAWVADCRTRLRILWNGMATGVHTQVMHVDTALLSLSLHVQDQQRWRLETVHGCARDWYHKK